MQANIKFLKPKYLRLIFELCICQIIFLLFKKINNEVIIEGCNQKL